MILQPARTMLRNKVFFPGRMVDAAAAAAAATSRRRTAIRRMSSSKTKATGTSTTNDTTKKDYNDHRYPHFEIRQTRWNDNDAFGHINNSIYYQYMDDAINTHLIHHGIGIHYPRFIAENGIQFFRPISFPTPVVVGLKVVQLGSSSVTYDVGFFEQKEEDTADDNSKSSSSSISISSNKNNGKNNIKNNNEKNSLLVAAAAKGKYVHVYVNQTTGRPVAIPDKARNVLQLLMVDDDDKDHE